MRLNHFIKKLFFILVILAAFSCERKSDEQKEESKISKLKLPRDFKAEHLYSPSEHDQGSWVAMTFDDKGRMITSDQYGALYRLELNPVGTDSLKNIERLDIGKTNAQLADSTKPKTEMGYAQGLLYAFNSLYVMVNHRSNEEFSKGSGLYRLQDTDGDDQFDKITLLKELQGEGEHGPHSIVLAPDKKSLYVVAGNFTKIPEMDGYRNFPDAQVDNLLPLLKDPNGHDNTVNYHGGWIANVDSTGTRWELISSGFRNPFDLAFNDDGEMFTYDSDMEWDFGTPWYRPTRICHVTSGSEFGWRPGTDKWSPFFPDNLPALLNIGQGSPTNVIYGGNSKFPEKYRKSVFAFDWSFGIIYAIHAQPDGASYKAEGEEFISGSPLPLTDGVIGPDGALYFLTGGRRLSSDLYRVYYDGKENTTVQNVSNTAADDGAARELRRQLETYHGQPKKGAVDFVWPYLKHEDRFIRYAARIALEHQPSAEWQARALKEKDPQILTQAIIALARKGKPAARNSMLKALTQVDYAKLSESQQLDLLRAFELVLTRMGTPETAVKNQVIQYLDPHYPANSNKLDRGLSKKLVYLEAPGAVEKTMTLLESAKDEPGDKTAMSSSDLILRNPHYGMDIAGMLSKVPPAQQTYYATVLCQAKTGWTPELHEKYFKWFRDAFGYKGGVSYVGFINEARKEALANVPQDQVQHFSTISGEELLTEAGNRLVEGPQPKGPGRRWTVDEAMPLVDGQLKGRSFEQGKLMFDAARCSSCHMMRGEGGSIGPDLTQLGTRFSVKDMLDAIIDPNKTVSDQYAATVFTLNDGSSVLGRLKNEDDNTFFISQNPFAPDVIREIPKKDVANKKYSYISIMYPGLINRLNEDELKDLLAYLMAGGDENADTYKK
jgi:putative heme-binding domain-containing protein